MALSGLHQSSACSQHDAVDAVITLIIALRAAFDDPSDIELRLLYRAILAQEDRKRKLDR